MTISELKTRFKKELSTLYTESEKDELFFILSENILGIDKFEMRIKSGEIVLEKDFLRYENYISELKTGKPYQQILGEIEFYGMKFFVDQNVLIPRPETEELLELAIEKIKISESKFKNLKILDIGTGSGIIPIVLKKHFPEAEIHAVDYSGKALEIAKKNSAFHQVEIKFIHQNYLEEKLTEVYDVIISNPPYIGLNEEGEIAYSVKEFEPKMALFSPTKNPLIFYEKIAADCENHLSENGMIFLEINQKLGNETLVLFEKTLTESALLKDISGNDRFVWAMK